MRMSPGKTSSLPTLFVKGAVAATKIIRICRIFRWFMLEIPKFCDGVVAIISEHFSVKFIHCLLLHCYGVGF